MSLNNLHELDIVAVAKKEQALAWLIENGPVLEEPALPAWILHQLAAEDRILRRRRGLYLVPTKQGTLPTLPETLAHLDLGGYLTGRAALAIAGLDDQEIARWWVVSNRRQADLRYGPYTVRFVYAPEHAKSGAVDRRRFGRHVLPIATAAQAIADEFRFAPFGIDYVNIVRVGRRALLAGRLTPQALIDVIGKRASTAVARRAGFLLDLLGVGVDADLLAAANAYRTATDGEKFPAVDPTWHLALPTSRAEILRAAR